MSFEAPIIKPESKKDVPETRAGMLIQKEGELLDALPEEKLKKKSTRKWIHAMTLASSLSYVLGSPDVAEARDKWRRGRHEVVRVYDQIEDINRDKKAEQLEEYQRALARLEREIEHTIRNYDRDIREASREKDEVKADQLVIEREEKVRNMEADAARIHKTIEELESSLRKQRMRHELVRGGLGVLEDIVRR